MTEKKKFGKKMMKVLITLYINYEVHREDGPAIIWYYSNGIIEREYYFLNGKVHRETDVAEIWYDDTGKIEYEAHWLNGITLSKTEFENKLIGKKIKLLQFVTTNNG